MISSANRNILIKNYYYQFGCWSTSRLTWPSRPIVRPSDGFKKNSSCSHAVFTVNELVLYFTKKGSEVYCAFLDATRAFFKVLHNGIYN